METLEDNTYRGDTLNTYNTMFGRPCQNSLHPGLDKFNPSKELVKKVECFQKYVCGLKTKHLIIVNRANVNVSIRP